MLMLRQIVNEYKEFFCGDVRLGVKTFDF